MEQQAQKKAWKTPELIVLVRSKPEEAVLAACKGSQVSAGPSSNDQQCNMGPSNDLCQARCDTWALS